MAEPEKVNTSFRMPRTLDKKLRALAKKQGVPIGYVIRKALEKYLNDDKNSI